MTDKTYLTLDTETSIKNLIGKNKASAFCSDNQIVCIGLKTKEMEKVYIADYREVGINGTDIPSEDIGDKKIALLIGQNIKFDLHHMRKADLTIDGLSMKDWLKTGRVWDTQVAAYLLSGQQHKFASLDELSTTYGGTVKDDRITALWKAGVDTEDIDMDMLHEYLEQDVLNTELVALAQMKEAADKGMMPLILAHMEALLALEEMEYNGLYVDTDILSSLTSKARLEHVNLIDSVQAHILTILPALRGIPDLQINLNSPAQIATLISGGTLKYKRREEVGEYKNGNTKYKNVEYEVNVKGIVPTTGTKTKTDEKTLTELQHSLPAHSTQREFFAQLLKLRRVAKEYNTYYKGIKKLIQEDGYVHHTIHQTSTSTGRFSSSEPNSQNMPNGKLSKFKEVFTSRYPNGKIIEVDYSQLEVVGLAYLSQDPQLLSDIRSGIDIHAKTGETVYGKGMSKEQRRTVKGINFGLIYGGGAKRLAREAGIAVHTTKSLIKSFYTRYPRVKEWQEENIEFVENNKVGSVVKVGQKPIDISELQSDTGRVYVFHRDQTPYNKYDAPWAAADLTYSSTKIKNYPVQGFATGDVVPTMLGVLHRAIQKDPRFKDVKLINTVHDSIVLDVPESIGVRVDLRTLLMKTLEDAPKIISDTFGIDFNLPLKVEITEGVDWKNQS